jgi:hypothetical protein
MRVSIPRMPRVVAGMQRNTPLFFGHSPTFPSVNASEAALYWPFAIQSSVSPAPVRPWETQVLLVVRSSGKVWLNLQIEAKRIIYTLILLISLVFICYKYFPQ